MNATTTNLEVRSYLDAVRAHLADVSERDLDDLLEDLEGHLIEVAAEGDGSLEERLGSPAVYAEELRATADLPSRQIPKESLGARMRSSFERSALGRFVDTAWGSKAMVAARTFLPELRPGWWVLRAYLVVWAAGILSYEGYYTNPFVPNLGSYAVGIAVTIGAIIASVAVGKAAQTQPNARRFSLLASVGIVAASLAALWNVGNVFQIQYDVVGDSIAPEYLSHPGGATINNICPYSTDGKLLSGVLLFDQDGRAIDGVAPLYSVNGYPVTPNSRQVGNAYPRDFGGVERFEGMNYDTGTQTPLICPPTLTGAAPAPTPAAPPTRGD